MRIGGDEFFMGWGQKTHSRLPPRGSFAIYSNDFFLETSEPWICFEKTALVSVKEIHSLLPGHDAGEAMQWIEPDFEEFKVAFHNLKSEIRSGQIDKIVPVVFGQGAADFDQGLIGILIQRVLDAPQHLIPYGLWDEHRGILGATPEVLFSLDGNGALRTAAIAGTKPISGSPASDHSEFLLNDPKERREHQLVIDDIASKLEPLGTLEIHPTQVLELPTLLHLKTDIEARPHNPFDFETAIRTLHPTAALGIAPRSAGLHRLRQLHVEPEPRRFGGPFGLLRPDGTALCLVSIRNIEWREDQVRLGSGCGLVEDSILDQEWIELAAKRDAVRSLLRL